MAQGQLRSGCIKVGIHAHLPPPPQSWQPSGWHCWRKVAVASSSSKRSTRSTKMTLRWQRTSACCWPTLPPTVRAPCLPLPPYKPFARALLPALTGGKGRNPGPVSLPLEPLIHLMSTECPFCIRCCSNPGWYSVPVKPNWHRDTTLSCWLAELLGLRVFSLPSEEILPELESGGIRELVQEMLGRFTSSLVSEGRGSSKPDHPPG